MSKVQTLRAFVQQRLTAAAEEISELFERTIAEYEEELCRHHTPGLLNAAFNPKVRLHRADIQQLLVSKEEVPPEQQEWSPSLDQEEPPEVPHSKEEEEELWSRQDGEQRHWLEEADISKITFTPAPVRSEEDDEDEPQSSQLHQRHQTEENGDAERLKTDAEEEHCGGPKPARSLNPDSHLQPDTHDKTSHSSELWETTREPQSSLNSLQNNKEPLSESSRSTNSEMKKMEKQRREVAASKQKDMVASSSDDEDSDVERNFALLTERGGGGGGEEAELYQGGEEEFSDDDEEESDGCNEDKEGSDAGEEESDGSKEEEEEEVEGDVDSEGSEDEDDDDDDDEEEEEAGGSSEVQTREDIKKELSNMSFEDILKMANRVGTKVYNEVAYGSSKSGDTRKKKRLNKNRPMEVSAKRPAPFLRQVVAVRKPTWRDPRFDDLSGEYKPEIFDKTYKFINDIKHREKEIVQKQLKKTKKNEEKKEKLQFLLKRMENQERAKKSREQQRERELQFKRQQRERANQGARPFFLKNSEKKKLQLAEKYQELKKSGKLENFLSKKRKRNAGKDRRKLPKQLQKKKAA